MQTNTFKNMQTNTFKKMQAITISNSKRILSKKCKWILSKTCKRILSKKCKRILWKKEILTNLQKYQGSSRSCSVNVVTDTMRLLMTCTLELLCRPGRRRRGWTLPSGLWHARWVHVIGEDQDSWHGADHWTVKHHHSMRLCPIHLAFVRFVLAAFPSVRPVAHEIKILWERAKNVLSCTFKIESIVMTS